jgi:hypothetical protein
MAISAISSISAGGLGRLYRMPLVGPMDALGRAGTIPRIESIPSIKSREEAGADDPPDLATRAQDRAKLLALDPRSPRSLARNEAQDRLDELLGQKAALEGRQARQKSQNSAEIVSVLSQLKSRDAEVRAHEAAHMAAGGRYITGGASYTYQAGPDGGEYAVGGEVGIDTSPVPGNPEETAQKMRIVRAAALAPSDPSAADLSVAASAAEAESAAMSEIAQARADELAARYGKEAESGRLPAAGDPGANSLDMVA